MAVKCIGLTISLSDAEFLYDHCRCPKCFHAATKQRLKPLPAEPPSVRAISEQEGSVKVAWGDGHETEYPWDFLARAAYDPPLQARRKERYVLGALS